jgi:hypothetical protein
MKDDRGESGGRQQLGQRRLGVTADGRTPEGMSAEARWGLGCLVAAAALIGSLVLVFVIAFLLDPPEWVQVLMGIGLVLEGALLAWLVAAALGRARGARRGPRPLDEE